MRKSRGKETCKRRNMQGEKAGKPNHDRVRVLIKIVMAISL
jgi:hypothetical protein